MVPLHPFAARLFLRQQARTFLSDPRKALAKDRRAAPESDCQLMDNPAMQQMLLDSQREAWIHGVDGMYDHSRAVALPWGFDPAQVTAALDLWQGRADPEIMPTMATAFAQHSGGQLHLTEDDGHLLVFSHWDEILHTLLTHRRD